MRTGLSKKQKTTSVFFDEASPIIEVCTYNTSLKKLYSQMGKEVVKCGYKRNARRTRAT